ncbi:MAG: YHS domain-containing protein [Betaproteobacteria bacterium]|nr:MAG: YHS domain-containing protein [Betaproteobacteria bacterium]
MSWLAQNWVWVVVAIAIAWFLFRGRFGGVLESLGGHGGGHSLQDEQPERARLANAPEAAVDAVSGEAVRTAQALSSVYQEKIYYFASKENRDRFEAAPQDYAQKVAGHPVRSAEPAHERPRRRSGGCC